MANPKRKVREGKENKVEEVEDTSSPPPPEDAVDPVAAQVIANFSSHWDKFKEGMAKDIKSLATTVRDPKTGLVKRVKDLEADVHTL